jgi:GTP cyclohydrolase II
VDISSHKGAEPSPDGLTRFAQCRLPTSEGMFDMSIWHDGDGTEVIALSMGDLSKSDPLFVRIHSQCFTSEIFGSLRCDCRLQLDLAQQHIAELGCGLLIYLQQEGRGIGLANKIRAYALQDDGADTIEANHRLGFADDLRDFTAAGKLLNALGVRRIHLHTNNPKKASAVTDAGIEVTKVVPSLAPVNEHNAQYLYTKAHHMGHVTLRAHDYSPFNPPPDAP